MQVLQRVLAWAARLLLFCMLGISASAGAQELLQNRSFESPVAPANGNNFYVTIPNWTVTSATGNPQPANIVRPWAGYAGNPIVTPTGGGVQYFDVNSSAGTLRQTITLPAAGLVDFSAWFSVRDDQQALSGLTVNIRNAGNVVVASVSTSFTAANPIGLWKQAAATNIPLAAGSYTFEIVLPDPANVDLASFVWKPPLSITKTSSAYSDPIRGTTNPLRIPGGVTEYLITVTSPAAYTVSNNTIAIVDATPPNADLSVVSIGGAGPAVFVQGSPSSTLAYTYTSLASTTDDIQFSNNGGASWTYTPVPNANGVDPAVTHVRLRPRGTMAAGSSFRFRLRYRVR
ncbi:hypothetical protein [Parasphingopyxis marina]|uniref:Uncharacterized protein n=1 Tax=Parasphingopyxis marina TaxID=2761622 RepID=A0A842HSB9_9SPHN|nr:hypothetical protein [Parasphingopyxis marina]MBC2776738.1 hypothetical protein [Parasphingopyxis marina]